MFFRQEEFFNPEALLQLLRVVKAADARVVLSSSWRLGNDSGSGWMGVEPLVLRTPLQNVEFRDRRIKTGGSIPQRSFLVILLGSMSIWGTSEQLPPPTTNPNHQERSFIWASRRVLAGSFVTR